MGPAIETYFGVLLLAAVALTLLLYLTRPLWRRALRYMHAWQRRDEEVEREEAHANKLRKEAEEELERECGSTSVPGGEGDRHETN